MKITQLKPSALKTLAFTFALALLAHGAQAADYAQRQALEARSASVGLGRTEVPLYERVAAPGRQAVLEELLADFADGEEITTRGGYQLTETGDRVTAIGDEGWSLTVAGDGTSVSYRNTSLIDDRPELALPVDRRSGQEELESLGRSFLSTALAGYVKLGRDEALVPSFTEFLIGGGGLTDGGAEPEPERVFASTVVFTRTLDDIALVGPGSKAAVTFANDGKVAGFDFDWATYQPTGETQAVLEVEGILERSVVLTNLEGAKVEHIECGYFDGGARRQDPKAPLQAGCYLQASHRKIVDAKVHGQDPSSGHTLSAQVEAVPAGIDVRLDSAWPATLAFHGVPGPPEAPEGETAPEETTL